MPHSFSNLLIHAVFSTKDRARCLDELLRSDLFPYVGGILRSVRAEPRLINGTVDHVHILARLPTDLSVADCMRAVKANSSRWVHEISPLQRGFAWQDGYAAFTVSASNEKAVFEYIRRQQQFHRRISFQEELLSLLKKHRVPFDERFVWE
jgi:putative transposase